MFKVMKENRNYFNSPLLIFKQKNIISSNVPTGFKSNSIILDFMASVISLTCWSLMLLYGMYWTGRAYGFLFRRSSLTKNKRTWVAPGCLFLTNRFLRYVKASCSTFCKADNILLPWGLLTQTCFHCFIFLNETLCFCNSMLNSTLSQQRAFNNSWDVFGALNFLVYASWAATRPSARNVTSTWRRSSSFCNLAMRWSLLDKRSLALQRDFRCWYSWCSRATLWSPKSMSPFHWPCTDSCKATLMSKVSTFIQNLPLGLETFNCFRASIYRTNKKGDIV